MMLEISAEKEEAIKQKLGQAIAIIPGKSEGWLMVGFEDEYTLYFKGNKYIQAGSRFKYIPEKTKLPSSNNAL